MPKQLQIFFLFCDYNFSYFWTYTIGKVFSRPFQWYITSPQIPKISTGKTKENCGRLMIAEQAGQKNSNGKTTMFFTSALKES
jgi:hypothetical protein